MSLSFPTCKVEMLTSDRCLIVRTAAPATQELVAGGICFHFCSTAGIGASPLFPILCVLSRVLFSPFLVASGQSIILGSCIPFSSIFITLNLIEEVFSSTNSFLRVLSSSGLGHWLHACMGIRGSPLVTCTQYYPLSSRNNML